MSNIYYYSIIYTICVIHSAFFVSFLWKWKERADIFRIKLQ